MLTQAELDAIRERCAKATPGPWFYNVGDSYCAYPSIITRSKTLLVFDVADDAPTEFPGRDEDAAFTAHSRADIPALLAHIDELNARMEANHDRR